MDHIRCGSGTAGCIGRGWIHYLPGQHRPGKDFEKIRSRRDYNKYIIVYDTVLLMLDEALQPEVLIETSYMTVSFPTVVLSVNSYIGEMMMTEAPGVLQTYALEAFEMKVQGLD